MIRRIAEVREGDRQGLVVIRCYRSAAFRGETSSPWRFATQGRLPALHRRPPSFLRLLNHRDPARPPARRPGIHRLRGTDAGFQIAWPSRYRLDGPAFVYTDRQSRRVSIIIGYPTQLLAAAERR